MSFCIYRSICSLNEAGYSNELFYFVFCCVILGPMRTSQRRRRHRPNMPAFSPDGNAEGPRHKDKGDDGAGNPKHLVDGKSGAHVPAVVRRRRSQSFDKDNTICYSSLFFIIIVVY